MAEVGTEVESCEGAPCGGGCCPVGEECVSGECVVCQGSCPAEGDCGNDTYCFGGCCVPWDSGPGGNADAECVKELEAGRFRPSLQCEWQAPGPDDPYPDYKQVLGTPMVFSPNIGMTGTAVSWIVFVGYFGSDGGFPASSSNGYVRIIDGKDCEDLYVLDDHKVAGACPVAVADLNGGPENMPEIIACAEGGGLVAFTYDPAADDWKLYWHSTEADGTPSYFAAEQHRWVGPTVVDLDGLPGPEILFGGEVFTAEGVRKGTSLGWNSFTSTGQFPLAVDVDSDASPELIHGNGIYGWTGSDWVKEGYFTGGGADGYVAVADFGPFPVEGIPEPAPEVVVVAPNQARIMSLDGSVVFGPYALEGGGHGGPPTVGDFDQDGQPEFALASYGAYQVFDFDCAADPLPDFCLAPGKRWSSVSQDYSSSMTGSSVFDFEGDGQAEAVYSDECYIRVYDGSTGEVIFSRSRSSCTWNENPVIADTDGDFRAEIVVGSNTNCNISCAALDPVYKGLRCIDSADCPGGPCVEGRCRCTTDLECAIPDSGLVCAAPLPGTEGEGKVCRASHQGKVSGIRVFRDYEDGWVASRILWNQHMYYVTNIKDNGLVPLAHEAKANWLEPGLNSFRQNEQGLQNPLAAADVTVEPEGFVCEGSGEAVLQVKVCNRGSAPLAADTPVYFFSFPEPDNVWPECVAETDHVLSPGQCLAVECAW